MRESQGLLCVLAVSIGSAGTEFEHLSPAFFLGTSLPVGGCGAASVTLVGDGSVVCCHGSCFLEGFRLLSVDCGELLGSVRDKCTPTIFPRTALR